MEQKKLSLRSVRLALAPLATVICVTETVSLSPLIASLQNLRGDPGYEYLSEFHNPGLPVSSFHSTP